MHAHEQNIKCRGCGKVFLKAGALLSHIEKNQCPGINRAQFETHRAMVAIRMDNMSNANNRDENPVSFATSTVGDSLGGGVRLDDLSLLDENETPDDLGEPLPTFESGSSGSSTSASKDHPVRGKLYESNYPVLGSEPKGKRTNSKASTTGGREGISVNESWVNHNFPDAPKTPAPPGWVPSASESSFLRTINPSNGQLGQFSLLDLKRDSFSGFYHCPFLKCP